MAGGSLDLGAGVTGGLGGPYKGTLSLDYVHRWNDYASAYAEGWLAKGVDGPAEYGASAGLRFRW